MWKIREYHELPRGTTFPSCGLAGGGKGGKKFWGEFIDMDVS